MSEHENSIDIDGLCCTECFYQGRIAEQERIIDFFKSELVRMEKESPSGGYYHNAAGMKMAIQLLEGTYEDDWFYEEDDE